MSNLSTYAESELRRAGYFDKDSDYEGLLGPAVMRMVEAFAEEGHSGYSARIAMRLFQKVANFEPLMPLTGEDDEWTEVSEGMWQNKRCCHVFKDANWAYDLDGKVFRYPDGQCYTNSRVAVVFPYVPRTEYVDVPDPNAPLPDPTNLSYEEIKASCERGEADVAAGRTVSCEPVLQRIRDSIARMRGARQDRVVTCGVGLRFSHGMIGRSICGLKTEWQFGPFYVFTKKAADNTKKAADNTKKAADNL